MHDFMHAKVTVADDVVFLGSFNLSRSDLAERLAGFVDDPRPLSLQAGHTA